MALSAAVSGSIQELAREEGFDLCGIAGVDAHEELRAFEPWISAGHHGEMAYLAGRNDEGELRRSSLRNAVPWARSVIVCAANYNTSAPYSTHAGASRQGWISRYAWTQSDYHDVVLEKLRRLEARIAAMPRANGTEWRSWCYVDTGPLVERVFARHAGIGWIGKNTCIINQQVGSWIFLGVIVTSLELTPDLPAPDRCGSCTRCLDACPTQAFTGPHQLDATRCIAYLTIEKRGDVPEDLREKMGRHVFGCDICQDVCPWNRKAPATTAPEFQAREALVNPALAWLAEMQAEEFREVFRKSPVKRTKLAGLKRNVAIAIGNSGDPDLLPQAERLADDDDPVVAEHGRWAVEKLSCAARREPTPK